MASLTELRKAHVYCGQCGARMKEHRGEREHGASFDRVTGKKSGGVIERDLVWACSDLEFDFVCGDFVSLLEDEHDCVWDVVDG